MRSVRRAAALAGQGLAILAGLATLATMVLIGIDVVLRFFNSSLPGTAAIVANYLMVVVAYLPLAWIERNEDMISVDLFSPPPGTRAARLSTILVGIVSLPVYGALAHATWLKALDRMRVLEFETIQNGILYIWPSYFAIPVALALAAFVVLLRVVGAFSAQPEDEAPAASEERS